MQVKFLLIFSLLTAFSGVVVAQSGGDYKAPRTEHGQPDLQGVWNFSSNTPMQRPKRYGEQEFLTEEQITEVIARQEKNAAAADADDLDYGEVVVRGRHWLSPSVVVF